MILPDFIIGYVCQKRQCGYLDKNSFSACPQCGQIDPKPFYNFYKILGLPSSFNSSQLSKAYKKLSLKYHPDLNPQGKSFFLIISEAYQTLKDTLARQQYDAMLHQIDLIKQGRRQAGYSRAGNYQNQGYYYGTYTYEDFENMFREFHRQRNQMRFNLKRLSQIAGALGGIMGFAGGFLVNFPISSLVGFLLGYLWGSLNPGLAPILLRIVNFLAVGVSIAAGFIFIFVSRNIFMILLIPLLLYGYLSISRNWQKELSALLRNKNR